MRCRRGNMTLKKGGILAVFPIRVLARRQVDFDKILQLIFANRASLNFWISLKPSPPSLFDKVSLDHDIQTIFLFSAEASH